MMNMQRNAAAAAAVTNDDADLDEAISALMDGELDRAEDAGRRRACLDRLCRDEGARGQWALWHATADALRSSEVAAMHSSSFSARMAQALEAEPMIVAPNALHQRRLLSRVVLPGAAAAAAVAMLAFVAVPMLQGTTGRGAVEIARVEGASRPAGPAGQGVASVARTLPASVFERPTRVESEQFEIYLSAHSQMSGGLGMPRTSHYLRQGVPVRNGQGGR
jgi:sigma-E factor negative regulatory protein RseA